MGLALQNRFGDIYNHIFAHDKDYPADGDQYATHNLEPISDLLGRLIAAGIAIWDLPALGDLIRATL